MSLGCRGNCFFILAFVPTGSVALWIQRGLAEAGEGRKKKAGRNARKLDSSDREGGDAVPPRGKSLSAAVSTASLYRDGTLDLIAHRAFTG